MPAAGLLPWSVRRPRLSSWQSLPACHPRRAGIPQHLSPLCFNEDRAGKGVSDSKCRRRGRRNACIANGAQRERSLLQWHEPARARAISCGLRINCPPIHPVRSLERIPPPPTPQSVSFLSFVKSDYCLLISLDPAAQLHMELHYSCGAWHPIPFPIPSQSASPADRQTDRPEQARDRRVNSAQRESCHYGRLIDRVKANENTWNPIRPRKREGRREGAAAVGRMGRGRGIDPARPSIRPSIRRPTVVALARSAQSAAEEIKFSAGDLFPFSCQRSTARLSRSLARSRASGR